MATAAVVICAYTEDRWEWLQTAIGSVLKQSVETSEFLVVIDHNEQLLKRLRDEFPGLRVVPSAGPRGLSGARNTALHQLRSEIVAFLDDDAEADPDWLRRLLLGFESPEVVGVGGRVIPLWEGARPAWFPAEFDWVVGCTHRGSPSTRALVRNLSGGCSAMRREVVLEAGGYRHELGRVGSNFAGCEETELAIRVRQRHPDCGFIYDPSATILHHVPEERSRWSYFWRRCYREGRSKAIVARFVGSGAGLSAERRQAGYVLPAALLDGLAASARGEVSGLLRACAIFTGLTCAVFGFVFGRVAGAFGSTEVGRATTGDE